MATMPQVSIIEILNPPDQSRKKFRNCSCEGRYSFNDSYSFCFEINQYAFKCFLPFDLQIVHLLVFWLCKFYSKKKTFYAPGKNKNPVIDVFTSGAEYTVLDIAAYYNHLEIIIWYKDVLGFSDINPKDNKGNTPLYWATNQGHLDVVKYYIQNGYHASSKIFSKYSHQYAFICYMSFTLCNFSFD